MSLGEFSRLPWNLSAMTVTVPAYEVLTAVPEEDPFRYGWRYVEKKGSNGRVEFEQIPLTLEDSANWL